MLKNAKSPYILKDIFSHIGINRGLKIVLGNKFLTKKLELSVKDFQETSRYIIIKINLSDNPEDYKENINNFIRSSNIDILEIYFNETKLEKIKAEISFNERISNITIKISSLEVISFRNLFDNCKIIKGINILNCPRRNINNMSYMFYGCDKLNKLDISRLKTDNVIDMSYMFYGCENLTEINANGFNTKNVINMEGMFGEDTSLTNLNISKFNTENVINMCKMFYKNKALKSLNIANFNTKKVKYMDTLIIILALKKKLFSILFSINLFNNDIYSILKAL